MTPTSCPTWVIQTTGMAARHSTQIVDALNELNEPWVSVGIVYEDKDLVGLPENLGTNIIPYGSCGLIKIAQQRNWQHLFFNEATARVDAWMSNHPSMLNADSKIVTLSQAKQLADERPSWFIRPLHDLKQFTGHVLPSDELKAWVTTLEQGDCEIGGQTLVAISEPKNIQMEWRHFIVDGKIVTSSAYRFNGQPHRKQELDPDVIAEAQALADIWLPHPCCCMDVALHDNKVSIVEFNGLNASGFYDHDVKALVKAISSYVNKPPPTTER